MNFNNCFEWLSFAWQLTSYIQVLNVAILNTDISQGSVVTQLRCGGIVNEDFVVNSLVNLSMKEFWNQSTFHKVMGEIIVACYGRSVE